MLTRVIVENESESFLTLCMRLSAMGNDQNGISPRLITNTNTMRTFLPNIKRRHFGIRYLVLYIEVLT